MALLAFIKKYSVVLAHIGIWVAFLSLWFVTVFGISFAPDNLLRLLVTFLPAAVAFYISNFIFFRFLPLRRYKALVIAEVIFFLFCFPFLAFNVYVLQPIAYGTEIGFPQKAGYWVSFLRNEVLWMYLIISTLSLGYYHLRQSVKRAQALKVSEQEKLKAEKGKLEAEYAFLRAQINPHFLHNTLNFFYAKSLGHSDELSDGILTLCDIMRYSLETGEDANGMVLLTKEVEHMQNVIKINQLRFSNRLQIDFQMKGELEGIRIIPLVLITLVENAFKHGELSNAEYPLTFVLEVTDEQQIYFSAFNKKRKGPKEISHGIGLENTRKRLAAAYPNRHTLEVKDEEEFYTIGLTIQLTPSEAGHLTSNTPSAKSIFLS